MTTFNPGARARQVFLIQFAKLLLAVTSVLIALLSYRFLFLGLEASFEGPIFAAFFASKVESALFTAHVVAAPIALGLGAFQFSSRLRDRIPSVHRWMGRSYGLAVLIGGGAGFFLSVLSLAERPVAGVGFGLLAILWIASMVAGVLAARGGEFDRHRKMMIVSFALAFSAVTLRVQLGLFAVAGYEYEVVSSILAWSCWVPNLIWAAWYLSPRTPSGARASYTVETGVSK